MFCLDRNYCRGSFIWHISQLNWMQSKNPFFIISSRSAIPKVSSIKSPFCTSEPATIAVQKSQVLIPGIPPASNGIPPNFQERNVGKLDQTFHGNSLTFSSQGHSSPPPNRKTIFSNHLYHPDLVLAVACNVVCCKCAACHKRRSRAWNETVNIREPTNYRTTFHYNNSIIGVYIHTYINPIGNTGKNDRS